MNRQIDCPSCFSTKTFHVPGTAWKRFCSICGDEWDIRSAEELAEE